MMEASRTCPSEREEIVTQALVHQAAVLEPSTSQQHVVAPQQRRQRWSPHGAAARVAKRKAAFEAMRAAQKGAAREAKVVERAAKQQSPVLPSSSPERISTVADVTSAQQPVAELSTTSATTSTLRQNESNGASQQFWYNNRKIIINLPLATYIFILFRLKLTIATLLLLIALGLFCYIAAMQFLHQHGDERVSNRQTKNETSLGSDVNCTRDDESFYRVCHEVMEVQVDCVLWDCDICFWNNDSCLNLDVGFRQECPTAVCTITPKPPPPVPPTPTVGSKIAYAALGILLVSVIGLLIYICKLVLQRRRVTRANPERMFSQATDQLAAARQEQEETDRVIQHLAAAANVPIPEPSPPRVSELEQAAIHASPHGIHTANLPETNIPTLERTGLGNVSTRVRDQLLSWRQNARDRTNRIRERISHHPGFSRLHET